MPGYRYHSNVGNRPCLGVTRSLGGPGVWI